MSEIGISPGNSRDFGLKERNNLPSESNDSIRFDDPDLEKTNL